MKYKLVRGRLAYVYTTTLSLPHKPYIVATADTLHHDDYIEWLQTYTYLFYKVNDCSRPEPIYIPLTYTFLHNVIVQGSAE